MQIQENISLKPYNTFGIDVTAKYFTSFSSFTELTEIVSNPKVFSNGHPLILGGGSNILFTQNISQCVLKNNLKGIELVGEDEDHWFIKANAGEIWHELVCFCVENGYNGLENLSLIPGNVGASPMQNIGAYGVEIKDVFHELEAYHLYDKIVVTFNLNDCGFGYRESVFKQQFKNQFVILNVTYKLSKKQAFNISYGAIEKELASMGVTELSSKAIAQAVINIRTSKLPDPKKVGNAGSFFKNPQVSKFRHHVLWEQYPQIPAYPLQDNMYYKLAAGWLIEQCGWKGYRKGDAGCYNLQALVLVNYGTAFGKEIYDLSEEIIQSVYNQFGVTLEREVNIF
ncbi:MAG: UDP-N-acetylmuramate dehydrogenase [Chitinophagaceae bacterium]